MSYQVTAPLVIVNDETGSQRYFYQGAVLPDGFDSDRLKELAEEGMLEKVKGGGKPAPEPGADDTKPTSVKDIVKAVGDDKAKAQEYLDEENAAENPRSSLVEKLQAVLAAE